MSKPYHPIDYAITSKGLKRLSDQESLQPISDALRAYIPITNVERHRYVEPIWHVDRGKVKKLIDTSQIVRVAGGLADNKNTRLKPMLLKVVLTKFGKTK